MIICSKDLHKWLPFQQKTRQVVGRKLTKLLNGTVGTPWQFQGDVDTSTLVDRTTISVQWYSRTCRFWYYSNQLSHTPQSFKPFHINSTHRKYKPTLMYILLWSPYVIGQTIIFLPCGFFLLSFFLSSPNLSDHRLDVYHTSSHGVALV